MLEAVTARLRIALVAVAALMAVAMVRPGEQALVLGVAANLAAGLAFSGRELLKHWKSVLSWALVWGVVVLGALLVLMWPLSQLIKDGGLHAALGVSAAIGLLLLLAWRYADALRMPNVFASAAFKAASERATTNAWPWQGLAVATTVLSAVVAIVLLAWPDLLHGTSRWVLAGVAAVWIPVVHFLKRPSGLTVAAPKPKATKPVTEKGTTEKPTREAKAKARKKSKDKTPAETTKPRGFASNAEVVSLDALNSLLLTPVADAKSVLPQMTEAAEAAEEVLAPVEAVEGDSEHPAHIRIEDTATATPAPVVHTEAEQAVLNTLLYEAARAGRVEQALGLLSEGAQATALPQSSDKDQRSVAVLAAVLPDLRLLRALIAQGAELNPDNAAQAPLAVATRDSWHGRPEAVATLLANGADARRADVNGNTALHHAAHSTDPAVAALLLDASSDINAINSEGVTPLLVAAKSGNWRVAKFLIERGAKLNIEGAMPALNAAARCDDDDAAGVELFIKHKAKLDATDAEGRSPVHMAARMGHIGIIQALLDHGMSITARDGNGRGVVHHAIEGETSPDFVKELLHMGARADFEDVEGFTPLKRARENARWALVSVLDPNFKPTASQDATPVARAPYAAVSDALANDDLEAVKIAAVGLNSDERIRLFEEHGLQNGALANWLLDNGLDPHAVNREGQALASLAVVGATKSGAHPDIARSMLARGAQINGRGVFAEYLTGVQSSGQMRAHEERTALEWLSRGADAFGENAAGETPLFLAVKLRWRHLTNELLARGAFPDAQNAQGMTPLHLSITQGDRDMVKALIAAGASPRLRANDGQTAHGLALAGGHKALIEWVDWRLWPSPARRLRAQDLPAAAIAGDLHAVSRLLELGFDVNTRDGQGCTGLLRAAGGGHADVLSALIAHGADTRIAADAGATPLSAAVSMRNLAIAEHLIDAGADVEQRLPGDVTALMLASALGLPKMAALLMRHGARVDAVDAQGLTALHCACLFAFGARDRTAAVTLMDTLLLAGAEPDPEDSQAVAPLLLLLGARAEPGTATDETVILSVLDQFLAEGVSLTSKDARGFGPLHVAALHGLMRVIKMLLRAGADPSARDALNRTAREVALMRGFVDVATELGTGENKRSPSMASYLRTPNSPDT
jgi:ankyrin repeat protein